MSPYNIEASKKLKGKDILVLLLPVLLGGLAWAVWVWEIVYRIGWSGLQWLAEPLYSLYAVAFLSTLSYLLPIFFWSRSRWYYVLLCVVVLSAVGYYGQEAGRYLFTLLYSREHVEPIHHVLQVWALFLLTGLVSTLFFFMKQWFLFRSGSFHVLTIMAVFISVIPASLATVEWFPGFGKMTSFVDAVKMGYPILWVNILLGWTSYAMVKKLI